MTILLISIIFILPTNLTEALVIFTAIMFGRMLPITAVTLALSLAFERYESGIMNKPPRPFGKGLFSVAILLRMLIVGGLGALIVFSLFYYYRPHGATIEFARTISVNALVMMELFYLFNCRFITQSIFTRDFFAGSRPVLTACVAVILLQLGFSYFPASQRVFVLEHCY